LKFSSNTEAIIVNPLTSPCPPHFSRWCVLNLATNRKSAMGFLQLAATTTVRNHPAVSFLLAPPPGASVSSLNAEVFPSILVSSLLDDVHGELISRAFDQSSSTSPEIFSLPLMLSCVAGAATSLGAAIVFMVDAEQIRKHMSFALSLAASVMLTVSAISIGPECLHGIVSFQDNPNGGSVLQVLDPVGLFERVTSFGVGCFSYWLLSNFLAVPEPEHLFLSNQNGGNPTLFVTSSSSSQFQTTSIGPSSSTTMASSVYGASPATNPVLSGVGGELSSPNNNNNNNNNSSSSNNNTSSDQNRYWRVTLLLFFSLLFHNFPEGLAVAASTMESSQLGITVTVGILIHNIPEGIAIAVPCIAARPDAPWLAFWLASGSGLAEPLGAMVALAVLKNGGNNYLPTDNNNNNNNNKGLDPQLILGTLAGIAIMVTTELYLAP
jgi:zinc transporter ZupT